MNKIKVEYTHENSVARVILDDGKGNVLDSIMMTDLMNLFEIFSSNHDLKMISFEGEGKHFSFGASVEEHTREKAGEMLKNFHSLFYSLIDLEIPTTAKIWGQCLGGGLELALFCNFMFATKSASIGQPEIVLGVFPPPASLMLPLKIGTARADELLLTGASVTADRAKEIGLVNEVYEDKEVLNAAFDEWLTKHICPKSASTLRFANKAGRSTFHKTLKKRLPKLEKLYVEKLMASADANEGINAFLEKRKPVWKNC